MREPTIARNYAEALFAAGERAGSTELLADLIEAVVGAIEADERVRIVLESPRVHKKQKQELLSRALVSYAPDMFLRFLSAVIKRGRQGILGAVSREYLNLVDIKFNRVHAGVTVARQPDETLQREIKEGLSRILGQEVILHIRNEPSILGGVIVRVGDRVMDGSIRRKLLRLRKRMLTG